MTMAERIQNHEEIEKANDKLFRRWKTKELHHKMIMDGRMDEAREVLYFLRKGHITLGLGDTDCVVELALTDLGYYVWYSRNGYTARVSA